jgi:xanthine dehydrogenase YagS FAD-binding subunit
MRKFTYTTASSADSAFTALDGHDYPKFIAGGTNLLDLMKENVERPDHLVDITKLAYNTIEENEDGGLRLGALVTNAETAYNAQVQERYPLLSQAILAGASPQLRNMATNGGNLLQRTRCYYFYDTATPCNKREAGTGCSAKDGYNRMHAILGTSEDCIAVHPSDMCVALAALDATVNVSAKEGNRSIPFADFHRLPENAPQLDTVLVPGEIITSIDLPAGGFNKYFAYLKLRDRASYAFALVSVAAALEIEGTVIKDVRVALGGVAHKPWRDRDAEAFLTGKSPSTENFEATATMILHGAKGYGDNNFKIKLAQKAIVRALQMAIGTDK